MVIAERAARMEPLLSWVSLAIFALLTPWGAAKHQSAAVVAVYVTTVAAVTLWGVVRAGRVAVIFDDTGVLVRNPCRTLRLAWADVAGLADGTVSRSEGGDAWALVIQARDGRRVRAKGTTHKREARPETLDRLRQIATAHAVTAELTGVPPEPAEPAIRIDATRPDDLTQLARRKQLELGLCLAGVCPLFAGVILTWPRGVNPHPDYSLSALLGWPTASLALRSWRVYRERRLLHHQMRTHELIRDRTFHQVVDLPMGEPGAVADPVAALHRYLRLPAGLFFAALVIAVAAGVVLRAHLFVRNSAPFFLFGSIVWTAGYSATILAGVCVWRMFRRRQFRRVLDAHGDRQAVVGCPSYASSMRPSALVASGHVCERVRLLSGQSPRWLADDAVRIRPAGRQRGPISVETASGAVYLGFVRRLGKAETPDDAGPAPQDCRQPTRWRTSSASSGAM